MLLINMIKDNINLIINITTLIKIKMIFIILLSLLSIVSCSYEAQYSIVIQAYTGTYDWLLIYKDGVKIVNDKTIPVADRGSDTLTLNDDANGDLKFLVKVSTGYKKYSLQATTIDRIEMGFVDYTNQWGDITLQENEVDVTVGYTTLRDNEDMFFLRSSIGFIQGLWPYDSSRSATFVINDEGGTSCSLSCFMVDGSTYYSAGLTSTSPCTSSSPSLYSKKVSNDINFYISYNSGSFTGSTYCGKFVYSGGTNEADILFTSHGPSMDLDLHHVHGTVIWTGNITEISSISNPSPGSNQACGGTSGIGTIYQDGPC